MRTGLPVRIFISYLFFCQLSVFLEEVFDAFNCIFYRLFDFIAEISRVFDIRLYGCHKCRATGTNLFLLNNTCLKARFVTM